LPVAGFLVKEVGRRFIVAAEYLTLAFTFNFLLTTSYCQVHSPWSIVHRG